MKLLLITILLIFFANGIDGQDLKSADNLRIEPHKSTTYQTETEKCVIFVRDYLTTLHLPLGKIFEWKIPAGTRYPLPAGKYVVENNSFVTLELEITSIEKCPEAPLEIENE